MRLLISMLLLLLTNPSWADPDALRNAANAAIAAGDTEVATHALRELLQEAPDDGASHYQLGTLLMDNGGNMEEASAHFSKAGELGFQPLGVAYRLSRIHARSGRPEAALEQLEIMADGGFGFVNLVDGHEDYASISNDERYLAAVSAMRAARFPCSADERHHAFDFWIGEWSVSQNGQFAGTNNIQPILGHCVIFEQWENASGGLGKSFNYYDPGYDRWRQIWISDNGTVIEFTGEARDGGIYYTAETVDPSDGSVTHHRFNFTQLERGDVRQHWETSVDGGETWTEIWDGRYTR